MIIEVKKNLINIIKEIHFEIVSEINKCITKNYNPKIVSDNNHIVGDVSYDIDVKAEAIVLKKIEKISKNISITLVMEGLGKKEILNENNEYFATIIVDPIDGTREIMYNKRSAWILTGIAFTKNPEIKDIDIAIQTEIPTTKQNIFSYLYALKGEGAFEEIYDKNTFECLQVKKKLSSSRAKILNDGYICFPNPFPGPKVSIANTYERFYKNIFPTSNINDAKVFSDEYVSTGGQIYLLATGCYRIVADIREFAQKEKNSLCCHPYDLCTVLIVIESGCEIMNLEGKELDYPLDTKTNCNWVGFANKELKQKYEKYLFESIFMNLLRN